MIKYFDNFFHCCLIKCAADLCYLARLHHGMMSQLPILSLQDTTTTERLVAALSLSGRVN